MRNFILSAAVLAFAGISASQAGTISNPYVSLQDTTKKDTVHTPQDTSKKDAPRGLSYQYANEQDTTAQAPVAGETAPQAATTEERTEVQLTALPDAVKTTLSADIFKEWVPNTAYSVKADNKEHYLIEVKKGEELRSIKLGSDGKVVE